MRGVSPSLPPVFGLVDIGTAKMACAMVSRGAGGHLELIGFGHQKSRGLKAGIIIDGEAAEDALRAAVAQAEYMSGHPLETVVLATTSGRMRSQHLSTSRQLAADGDPAPRFVTDADIDTLMTACRSFGDSGERLVLHMNTVGVSLDGRGFADGVGRRAKHLALDLNAVSAERAAVRGLVHLAERCQLDVATVAPAPIASALGATTAKEREAGVLVIDLGAGSTGVALYLASVLVAAHVFPIGGNLLSYDLMRLCGVDAEEAERIKKNCDMMGDAHPSPDAAEMRWPLGDHHAITAPATSGEGHSKVEGANISTVLTSRIDALLLQIQDWIGRLADLSERQITVVLTGGASLLGGLQAHVERAFSMDARIAAPAAGGLLPRPLWQPSFATLSGLEAFARDATLGLRLHGAVPATALAHAPQTQWGRPCI